MILRHPKAYIKCNVSHRLGFLAQQLMGDYFLVCVSNFGIEKQCDHLSNLSELEGIPRADWSEENNYLSFLTDCIDRSGEEYT